jgi:hypothetical protein
MACRFDRARGSGGLVSFFDPRRAESGRRIIMLLTLLALAAVAAPITAVTVHDGHARVVRTASLTLSGRQTVELPALPPTADPASVRLEADGAEVQSIELRRPGPGEQPLDPPALLEIERLDDAIATAEHQQTLFTELTAVAGWKPAPPGDDGPLGTAGVDPRGWRRALGFLTRFADRMDARRRALDGRLHDLRAERARHLGGGDDEQRAAGRGSGLQVVATVEGQGPARLRLQYVVPGAEWRPSYEVRLDPGREQVSLALSAFVSQQTGEDWPGAQLTLSTAEATLISAPPPLAVWRIGERERFVPETERAPSPAARQAVAPPGTLGVYVFDQTGMPIKGVRLTLRPTSAGSRSCYTDDEGHCRFSGLGPGSYELSASAPKLLPVTQRGISVEAGRGAEANLVMEVAGQVEEVKVVERAPLVSTTTATVKEVFDGASFPAAPSRRASPAARAISLAPPASAPPREPEMAFAALLPDSVRSGQPPRRIPLRSWTFPVELQRTLFPALAPEAYLLARLQHPAGGRVDPRLPAGPAALFVGDDPAGRAELTPLAPGRTFDLPLGVDRDLRAIRRVTMATRQEGLFRRREIARYTVTIEITNPHPRPVRLALHDQIPIAGDAQVESRLLASTPAAAWDRETGALTWQLDLTPARIARVTFVYELSYPKGHVLRQEGATP